MLAFLQILHLHLQILPLQQQTMHLHLPPHHFLTNVHLFALQLRLQSFLMLQIFLILGTVKVQLHLLQTQAVAYIT